MPSKNNPRRRISLAGLIIIGAVLGLLIKNIKKCYLETQLFFEIFKSLYWASKNCLIH